MQFVKCRSNASTLSLFHISFIEFALQRDHIVNSLKCVKGLQLTHRPWEGWEFSIPLVRLVAPKAFLRDNLILITAKLTAAAKLCKFFVVKVY